MIMYSSEFPLLPEKSINDVLACAWDWIIKSPHTEIAKDKKIPSIEHGIHSFNVNNESVMIGIGSTKNLGIGGIKYSRVEDTGLIWTTTIVSRVANGENFVSIQVLCESLKPTVILPSPSKPRIFRKLILDLGGGMDGQIPVTDRPYWLDDGEENIAAALINGVAKNKLPIIYVSCARDNYHALNPKSLASTTSGLAHVIVEPTRRFSLALRRLANSNNAYRGAVGVYWPESNSRTLYYRRRDVDGECLQRQILDDIKIGLANRRQAADCNWLHLQEVVSRNKLDKVKESGETDIDVLLTAYDGEINAKNDVIASCEAEILRLNLEVRRLNSQTQNSNGLLKSGNEQDYYDNEVRDTILSCLSSCRSSLLDGSRVMHIINDVLRTNEYNYVGNHIASRVKNLLRSYKNMDGKLKSALEELGFSFTDEGKHYKMLYNNDGRYTFSLSKTASDHRSGMNMSSDIAKKLFHVSN